MNIRQVYIAAKYTADTRTQIVQNISRALAAACALAKRGYFPICPHSSGSHRVTWPEAMERCFEIIQGMDPAKDCLVLLPGWEDSRGACEERELAMRLGIPVLLLADALEVQVAHVG